jgi:2-methylcitrate dehydratase PrpD
VSGEPTVTERLARFAVETRRDDLPSTVVDAVRRAVLDSLGVTIAGATHPAASIMDATLAQVAGPGPATVVGFARRTDVLSATTANGLMAHVLDWDDALLPMRLRAGATLVPSLLASGEVRPWSDGAFVSAYAVGFEIQARLAASISPVMPERGWHGTGVVGGIGVAAAVGRLLGLDVPRTVQAMGIAGTAAQGLVATFGSMSKGLNLGRAAAAGVQSAHLAAGGFTSHPDLLDRGGFLRMYDDAPRTDGILEGLGEHWAVVDNGYKPYPCGVVAHAAIDAMLELRAEAPAGDHPREIRLRVSPETIRLMGAAEPRTGLEAKFSVRYVAAAAWVDGTVDPGTFADAAPADPRYRDVMAAIRVEASPEVAQDEAVAEVGTVSGWSGQQHVRHARGTKGRPMSDEELRDKFRVACAFAGNPHADALITLVEGIDAVAAAEITALLVGDRGAGR